MTIKEKEVWKMKLLLYCTKAKPYLYYAQESRTLMEIDNSFEGYKTTNKNVDDTLNGKIVAECDYEVEEIDTMALSEHIYDDYYDNNIDTISKESCLTPEQMSEYLGDTWDSIGYAIHIKNLHIFDKPKELSDYYIKQCQFGKCSTCEYGKNNIICSTIDTPITKAPQNMMYAYDNEWNRYILTSIQPQWLCKILNGEKTVEVRKKVLKEMIENE